MEITTTLSQMEAALRARTELNVAISSQAEVQGKRLSSRYEWRQDAAGRAELALRVPAMDGNDRLEHDYRLVNGTLYGLDRLNSERLQRPVSRTPRAVRTMALALGGIDESVLCVASPDDMRQLVQRYRGVRDWIQIKDAPNTLHFRRSSPGQRVELVIDAKSKLPLRVQISQRGDGVTWQFAYRTPRPIPAAPLTAPGTLAVKSFLLRPALPAFDSVTTEREIRRMFLAYRDLRNRTIEQSDGDRVYIGQNGIGQDHSTGAKWRFENPRLTIGGKTWAQGSVPRGDVLELVTKRTESPVSPIARDWVRGVVPYRNQFRSTTKLRRVGALTVGGRAVRIYEATGSRGSIRFELNPEHLIDRIETRVTGPDGGVISRSTVSFRYLPLSPVAFRLTPPRDVPVATLQPIAER
ncbi:MAG: hypothetical protein SFX74_00435 [Fimbriimonadaceae bacterium]|nr:hypothetical protein [Fimbriimonadaceae bacterium]